MLSKDLLFYVTVSTNGLHCLTDEKWLADFRRDTKLEKGRLSSGAVFLTTLLWPRKLILFLSGQCVNLYCSLSGIKLLIKRSTRFPSLRLLSPLGLRHPWALEHGLPRGPS